MQKFHNAFLPPQLSVPIPDNFSAPVKQYIQEQSVINQNPPVMLKHQQEDMLPSHNKKQKKAKDKPDPGGG